MRGESLTLAALGMARGVARLRRFRSGWREGWPAFAAALGIRGADCLTRCARGDNGADASAELPGVAMGTGARPNAFTAPCHPERSARRARSRGIPRAPNGADRALQRPSAPEAATSGYQPHPNVHASGSPANPRPVGWAASRRTASILAALSFSSSISF